MESSAGERNWAGLVAPALVTVLLGIQFFLGFRGFDHPDGGLIGLLEAPGALFGWGGVVILAILLGWLIAGLVGRDLFGLQGASGLAVRLVGCVALGVALSGVFGILDGAASGGEVGAAIGGLLAETLDELVAMLLLLLMALPAFVLSIAPFFTTGPKVRKPGTGVSMDALADLEPKPGLYEGSSHQPKPLYPERRFDEEGHEIPMTFGARDVGQVRYADEGPDPDAVDLERKPDPVPMDEDSALPDGIRFVGQETDEDDEGSPPEPVDEDDRRIPLADGVRFADEDEDEEVEAAEDADHPEEEEEETDDAEVEAPPAVKPKAAAKKQQKKKAASRKAPPVAPRPVEATPPPEVTASDALDHLQDADEGARYRAKLEGSGIFDEPPPPRPVAKKKAAAARKKKATPSAKKKKASPARKTTAKKKTVAATKKKKTAAKKKKKATATSTKKKVATKKAPASTTTKKKKKTKAAATGKKKTPAAKKKTKKKPATRKKVEDAPADASTRKGTSAIGPADEIYGKAVAVALERSAASSVLLSRRLGIGYAQARALIELLVADGILGEMTPSGSRPVLVTEEEWDARSS